MYYNVKAEIYRKGWTLAEFAKRLGMAAPSLTNKLNGKVGISLEEALRMKAVLGVNIPVEVLFARSKAKS